MMMKWSEEGELDLVVLEIVMDSPIKYATVKIEGSITQQLRFFDSLMREEGLRSCFD